MGSNGHDLSSAGIGNDYFCDVIDLPKDHAKSASLLHTLIPKCEQKKAIDTIKSMEKQKCECRQDFEEHKKIAEELLNEKRKQFINEKQRQLLRENNQELKELEHKLRTAYCFKALKCQIAEKEELKKQEMLCRKREDAIINKGLLKEKELIQIEEEEEKKKKQSLLKDLQEQISKIQQERAKRYEEFLREKKLLNEIAAKIQEEQLEEIRFEIERKKINRAEVDEFRRIREAWEKQKQKDTKDEDEKIRKFSENREREIKEKEEKRKEEIAIKAEISEKIAQEVAQIKEEKLRREEVLNELYAAEYEVKEEEKIRQKIEKELRQRIQLRIEFDQQIQQVFERKQKEKEDDKKFYEEQMRVLSERDKLELLSDEKRRRKLLEHRRELQKCLDEKKMRRAEEVAKLLKQRELEIQEEKTRQEVIEEERIKLLKEHMENLIGYLPPGLLKETDREHFVLPTPSKN